MKALLNWTLFLAIAGAVAPGCNDAVNTRGPSKPEPVDRTNTGVNVRDRDRATKTPIDQNETKGEVNITASIRKQVVDTKMSVNAQNVKIITQDGKVTLRGPVKSQEEKDRIEKIAADVAGAGNVDSHLEVETSK